MVRLTIDDGSYFDFDEPCTQQEFGYIVGISQQAVSNLVTRGVLLPGQSAQEWMHRYLTNLREQALDRLTRR